MSARGMTLATRRPGPARPAGVVVVADGSAEPEWVALWCGREQHRQRVPMADAGDSATADARIAEIAAAAARRGGSVLVVSGPTPDRSGPPRVVAAVRSLPGDALVIAEAAATAVHMGADVVVAHGVPTSFGERSVGLDAAVENGRRLLRTAAEEASRAVPGIRVESRLVRVRPHELVGEGLDADLLVLGGAHPRLPARLGLVACSALHHAPCPVLLAPRPPVPATHAGAVRP
jgi:nucleotide-binding universal stress UspA family protein